MELNEELKKNPRISELWGKYTKSIEEINLVKFELMGKTGDVEIDSKLSIKADNIDLINRWKNMAEQPVTRSLSVIQLAKIIILDKFKNIMRLNMDVIAIQKDMLDEVGMLKPKEKKGKVDELEKETPEYEITKEDEPYIEKLIENIKGQMDKGKSIFNIKKGLKMNINRWKSLEERPKELKILDEAYKRIIRHNENNQ